MATSSSGGIGLAGILTIIFVIFKLVGKITWSWWWVFSPVIISAGIGLLITLVVFLFMLLAVIADRN